MYGSDVTTSVLPRGGVVCGRCGRGAGARRARPHETCELCGKNRRDGKVRLIDFGNVLQFRGEDANGAKRREQRNRKSGGGLSYAGAGAGRA